MAGQTRERKKKKGSKREHVDSLVMIMDTINTAAAVVKRLACLHGPRLVMQPIPASNMSYA